MGNTNNAYDIESLIEQTQNMQNVSIGGSACYDFGDKVLVRYSVRNNEEQIAEVANMLHDKGVNTPRHLAIQREKDSKKCWVLQEKCPGVSYSKYTMAYDKVPLDDKLKCYSVLLNIPDEHYIKLFADLCELKDCGIELKSKNIFYDKDKENGGFYIIDLLDYNYKPFVPTLRNIYTVSSFGFSFRGPYISEDMFKTRTQEEYENYLQMRYALDLKLYKAKEQGIPGFEKYKRWVLRKYDSNQLSYFKEHGVEFDDLTLTEEEQQQFEIIIDGIVDKCIDKLQNEGQSPELIKTNVVWNDMQFLLSSSLPYNPRYDQNIERDEYDEEITPLDRLKDDINSRFDGKIADIQASVPMGK